MINIPPLLIGLGLGVFLAKVLNKEEKMIDCSKKITSFYNEKVALPESMKKEMRARRDANRARLNNSDLIPIGMWSQGSYAMHTMVQTENNDFDIDDGVYFKKEDLIDRYGIEKTPDEMKRMVKKAVSHHGLKEDPEIKENCVRVKYEKGYHIDIPVYRTVNYEQANQYYELAAAGEWKKSDPRAVTKWFNDAVSKKSPDSINGQQMRRIVRLLKDLVKRNTGILEKGVSGFIISKLVEEEYEAHENRDDEALYYTMKNIHERLEEDMEVRHPIIDEMLTEGLFDPKITIFKKHLKSALNQLDILFETDDPAIAQEAWGDVFQEQNYFSEKVLADSQQNDFEGNLSSQSIWEKSDSEPPLVDKRGGGRNA